jgi:hypothetical protein
MKNSTQTNLILPEKTKIKRKRITMFQHNGLAWPRKRDAEYNAAIDRRCEACGKPTGSKHRLLCPECSYIKRTEKFLSFPVVEWDGETPLSLFDSDEFFFGEDDIDFFCEDTGAEKGNLQLVICEPSQPPVFDMTEFLEAILPEDWSAEDLGEHEGKSARDIESMVNKWLSMCNPISWEPSNKRVVLT